MSSAIELLIMHHENMRVLYPDDELMVLCECDGALYDTRVLALQALQSFDAAHATRFFTTITVDHLPRPLPDIDELLCLLELPLGISTEISAWYKRHIWNMDALWCAHRPLAGVMNVLTCLQMQERTHIGLCAERAGRTIHEFITRISRLGRTAGLSCDPETVFLDDTTSDGEATERSMRAWRHFQQKGFRLMAVIDSHAAAEPAHIFSMDSSMEVLFLQAPAIREMTRIDIEPRALRSPDFMPWDLLNARVRSRALPGGACSAYSFPAVLQEAAH